MAHRPQLAILHLALWAFTSAAYLAVIRIDRTHEPGSWDTLRLILVSIFAGAAIAAALVVTSRLVQSSPFSVAPGEWLMCILGIHLLVDAVIRIPSRSVIPAEAILMAAGCLATVMPILSRRIGRMWKAYFLLLLALQCASIVIVIAQQRQFVQVPALDMVRQLTISFALTIPILLAIWDRKSDGGWLHWSGISWNSTWYAFLVWRELGS